MFVLWLSNLALVSVVAFFHFLLDYDMLTIESWLFHQGWELLGLNILISLVTVCKFLYLKTDERFPFRAIMLDQLKLPRLKPLFTVLGLFVLYIVLTRPVPNTSVTTVDYSKLFLGYMFCLTALSSLKILIISIDRILPLPSTYTILFRNVIFALLLTLLIRGSHLHGANIGVLFGIVCFCLFYLSSSDYYLSENLILSSLFVTPSFVLFGLDPVWGSEFSPYTLQSANSESYFLGLLLAYCFFLWLRFRVSTPKKP
jgi:hypothetical protein